MQTELADFIRDTPEGREADAILRKSRQAMRQGRQRHAVDAATDRDRGRADGPQHGLRRGVVNDVVDYAEGQQGNQRPNRHQVNAAY